VYVFVCVSMYLLDAAIETCGECGGDMCVCVRER